VEFPLLRTRRLVLRELVAADAPVLFSIYSDVTALRYFGSDPLITLDQAAELIETFSSWRAAKNPGIRWGIEVTRTCQLIGTCGLHSWNRDWQKCSTGYELAQEAWGQGYMTEALSAALAWGMDAMSLNRVEALIHPSNDRSLRLAHRLRFEEEGRLRQVARWNSQFQDLLLFSLLRSDWTAKSQP
jgi:[ribosomal protein S5]-alanine N-acetyltransferase